MQIAVPAAAVVLPATLRWRASLRKPPNQRGRTAAAQTRAPRRLQGRCRKCSTRQMTGRGVGNRAPPENDGRPAHLHPRSRVYACHGETATANTTSVRIHIQVNNHMYASAYECRRRRRQPGTSVLFVLPRQDTGGPLKSQLRVSVCRQVWAQVALGAAKQRSPAEFERGKVSPTHPIA